MLFVVASQFGGLDINIIEIKELDQLFLDRWRWVHAPLSQTGL